MPSHSCLAMLICLPLLHAARRWHKKPSKKNLFSLKGCSRVDRTKSHCNDTFMYLHLGYSYPRCYCYDYCPNWNVLGVDIFNIFLTYDNFNVQWFYRDITPHIKSRHISAYVQFTVCQINFFEVVWKKLLGLKKYWLAFHCYTSLTMDGTLIFLV